MLLHYWFYKKKFVIEILMAGVLQIFTGRHRWNKERERIILVVFFACITWRPALITRDKNKAKKRNIQAKPAGRFCCFANWAAWSLVCCSCCKSCLCFPQIYFPQINASVEWHELHNKTSMPDRMKIIASLLFVATKRAQLVVLACRFLISDITHS